MRNERSNKPEWTANDIPSQEGRLAIVTGTGGLGYETALVLARRGAEVILAGRNKSKGDESIEKIRSIFPKSKITFELLDLADLAYVADFADRFSQTYSSLDLLINNAGVMSPPHRQTTTDGLELQFGTNYLGHFALTLHLLPQLKGGKQSRIVNVSSLVSHRGAIQFNDLQGEDRYSPSKSYAQSKLAMLMFALELQQRSYKNGWGIMCNAAHPGASRTELMANGPGNDSFSGKLAKILFPIISHSAAAGALPTLFAATSPNAKGGAYYGPNWFFELKGPPEPSTIPKQARDTTVLERLWNVSEQLTNLEVSRIGQKCSEVFL
jgi:NAD(P)-dependent dehydrogenase (short-subunit alcohol dehydrogenase family)